MRRGVPHQATSPVSQDPIFRFRRTESPAKSRSFVFHFLRTKLPVKWSFYLSYSAGKVVADVGILYRLLPAGNIAGQSRSYLLLSADDIAGEVEHLYLLLPADEIARDMDSNLLSPAGDIAKEVSTSRGLNPRTS